MRLTEQQLALLFMQFESRRVWERTVSSADAVRRLARRHPFFGLPRHDIPVSQQAQQRQQQAPRSRPSQAAMLTRRECPHCVSSGSWSDWSATCQGAKVLAKVAKAMALNGPGAGVWATPAGDGAELLDWVGRVRGPGPAYHKVPIALSFCPHYPLHAPRLFACGQPRPFHPNVDPQSGEVCIEWAIGHGGLVPFLLTFRVLVLGSPGLDQIEMPANPEAAALLLSNRAAFDRRLDETLARAAARAAVDAAAGARDGGERAP
jgi:ubiquitin-protein ligase